MKWFKKEPIQPKEVRGEDIIAKVYELHPDRKYLFWFERTISPQYVDILRRNLENVVPNQISMIAGMYAPVIYEFEETENGTTVAKPINTNNSGEEGKP